jgi:hypothetical protein
VATPTATTSQVTALAVSFASNVSTVAVGGTNAPGSPGGIALGAGASATDSGVPWLEPLPASGAWTPPALVPPSETAETAPELRATPADARPYPAGLMWNSDGGSPRAQPPVYATDVSAQTAVGLVLLGAVQNGRGRASLDEKTKARLLSIRQARTSGP